MINHNFLTENTELDRNEIAELLNVPAETVSLWLQNRRATNFPASVDNRGTTRLYNAHRVLRWAARSPDCKRAQTAEYYEVSEAEYLEALEKLHALRIQNERLYIADAFEDVGLISPAERLRRKDEGTLLDATESLARATA